MSALRYGSTLYPPSNKRRCAKGRPNYTEPSDDILVSESVNHDINSNDSHSQNEYSSVDAMQPEDVEEELTIDISTFLHENPWLAHSSCESSVENNVVSPESCSLFHVTVCETKPLDVHKVSWVDEACTADAINSTVGNSVSNDNLEALAVKKMEKSVIIPTDLWEPEIPKSRSEDDKTYLSNLGPPDSSDANYNSILKRGFDEFTESDSQKDKSGSVSTTYQLIIPSSSMIPKEDFEIIPEYSECKNKNNNIEYNDLGENDFKEEKSHSVLSTGLKISEVSKKLKVIAENIDEYSKCKSKSNNSGFNDFEESELKEEESGSDLITVLISSEASIKPKVIDVYNTEYSRSKKEKNYIGFEDLVEYDFQDLVESDFRKLGSDSRFSTLGKIGDSTESEVFFEYIDEYSECIELNDLEETYLKEEKSLTARRYTKSTVISEKPKMIHVEGFNEYRIYESKSSYKRKKYAEDTSEIPDTLKASECDYENNSCNEEIENLSLKLKALLISSEAVLDSVSTETTSVLSKSNKMFDTPPHISVNSSHSTNFKFENKFSSQYCESLSVKPKVDAEYINEHSKYKYKNNNRGFNESKESNLQEENSASVSSTPLITSESYMKAKVAIVYGIECTNCKRKEIITSGYELEESDEEESHIVLSTELNTPEASKIQKTIFDYINEYSERESDNNYNSASFNSDSPIMNFEHFDSPEYSAYIHKFDMEILNECLNDKSSMLQTSFDDISMNKFNDLENFDLLHEKRDSILSTVLTASEEFIKPKVAVEDITENSKCKSKNYNKRNKCAEDSSQTSDNLPASESKDDNESGNVLKEIISLKQKALFATSRDVSEAVMTEATSEFLKSPENLNSDSTNLNSENEYSSDYTVSLSEYNVEVVDTDKKCHVEEHLPVFPQENLMVNSSVASVCQDVSNVINSDVSNTMCGESLNECLNDKSNMLQTSFDDISMNKFNDLENFDLLHEKRDSILSTVLTTSEEFIKPKVAVEDITENSKCKSKNYNKRNKCAEDSSQTSDNLPASESKVENESGNVLKEIFSLKQKALFATSRDVSEAVMSEATSEFLKSPENLNSDSTNLNAEKALDTFSPVSIKEEQLDEEEDIGRNSISIKGILEADNTHKRPIATPHTPPDQNLFHNANNILDKDICDEKGNILFPENNVFDEIDKLVPVSTSLFDDNSLLDKTTTKYTNAKIVLDTVSPVSNKDPLDEKKNIGMNSSLNNLSSQVKSENSQAASEAKKKKQGRLHTASASKISPSNVMLSSALKEACTHETQKYKGQTKKTVLSAPSTSSIGTENKYDAELVCVPLLKANIGMNSTFNNLSSHVKSENSQAVSEAKKRKKGRPQAVSEAKKKKQGTPHTVSANKISPSNMMVSSTLKGPFTHETIKSKGQKKKTVLSASSTSSIRTKNYYDAELVCVPFSMGWRRLHVIRATGRDDNNKRLSDIYYFAPDGTKFRSKAEIGTYLSKYPDIKLTLKNFTFAKKLIYRKPFEIERYARQKVTKAVKKVVSKRKSYFSEVQRFDALNEKLFGKYPVVKCEKLEIENFVKNNKIKVSNWPLHHTETPKNNKPADFKKESN